MKPTPKPSDSRSYARRVVSVSMRLPASAKPRRIENTGIARTISTAALRISAGQGCAWITRLQRYQKELRSPSALPASVGSCRNGTRRLSMLRPTKPSIAGSSVIAASIVISTASTAPIAMLRMKSRLRKNMPSSEITTVRPAKTTARPEVSTDRIDGVFRLQAVVQPGAVARHDQQRVVDADADADHRRDLRREVRHRKHPRHQPDQRRAAADAEQRSDNRQAHRQDGAEDDAAG